MLTKLIDIVSTADHRIEDATLFCDNIYVVDEAFLEFIRSVEEHNLVENTDYKGSIDELINLEFSLPRLNSIGFYENSDVLITKNRYQLPVNDYYIYEFRNSKSEFVDFKTNYNAVLSFINSLKYIAKHTYTDIEIENVIIFSEDISLMVPLLYKSLCVISIDKDRREKIENLTAVFNDSNSEKKLLFINELIDFLILQREVNRFELLLASVSELNNKCENAYQFYLRDFSYNKLKVELDTKALEYSKNIQSVINDSQTKLIAIPTAFILVFANFDFSDLVSVKNFASMFGLFVFSLLLQLFLNNQKSILKFIKENVLSYRETFKENEVESISSKFALVERELLKQKERLFIIELILWVIPISFLGLWLALIALNSLGTWVHIFYLLTFFS